MRKASNLSGALFYLGLLVSTLGSLHRAEAAEENPPFPVFRQQVSGTFLTFSGERLKSLTGPGNGYGGEFSAVRGNSMVSLVSRVRFQIANGSATLTDSGIGDDREVSFRLTSGEGLLGVRLNLLPHENFRVQPYFGASGKLSLNHLALSGLEAASSLSRSSTAMLFGYEIFTGVEFVLSRGDSGIRTLLIELQARSVSGAIGGASSLSLGGLGISVGTGW